MLAKNILSALSAGILRRNTHAQSVSAHVPGTQPPSNGRRLPGTYAVTVQCYVGRTVSFQDKGCNCLEFKQFYENCFKIIAPG